MKLPMKFVFFSVVLFLSACQLKTGINKKAGELPVTPGMNAGKDKFDLHVPDGWTSRRVNKEGVDYYFLNSPKSATDSAANINVVTEDMQGVGFEKYLETSKKMLKDYNPSVKFINEGKIKLQNKEGAWFRFNLAPNGTKIFALTFIFPRKGIAYVMTCATSGEIERYKPTFDSVAKSLFFIE